MSEATKKKIRDAVGVKPVNQIIKLAKMNDVDVGKQRPTQIKRGI